MQIDNNAKWNKLGKKITVSDRARPKVLETKIEDESEKGGCDEENAENFSQNAFSFFGNNFSFVSGFEGERKSERNVSRWIGRAWFLLMHFRLLRV